MIKETNCNTDNVGQECLCDCSSEPTTESDLHFVQLTLVSSEDALEGGGCRWADVAKNEDGVEGGMEFGLWDETLILLATCDSCCRLASGIESEVLVVLLKGPVSSVDTAVF